MVMNAFDTNFDDENEVYAVNTVAHAYLKRPIRIDRARPVRVYLVNITEFDPINSFHLHANFFDYYDHGTTLTPTLRTVDTVMQCQAQRGILEFTFADHEPGALHVPRPPVRVRRARLDEHAGGARGVRMRRALAWAVAPGAVCWSAVAFLCSPIPCGGLGRRPPIERLTVERTALDGDGIALPVRAGGSEPVEIAQVQVDGAYWASPSIRRGRSAAWQPPACACLIPGCRGRRTRIVMLTRTGLPSSM